MLALLRETTRFIFRGVGDARSIDRITTLTALDKPVVFRDNKEGSLGLRVRRELEQPAEKPEQFTDAEGKVSKVPVLDNTGVTGLYTSSEGLKGDKVWGTQGRWCMLAGKVGSEPVTIAMLDHPSNPNSPTYWHARGYGLFSANVFGRKVFDPKQEELTLTLEPGQVRDLPPSRADSGYRGDAGSRSSASSRPSRRRRVALAATSASK